MGVPDSQNWEFMAGVVLKAFADRDFVFFFIEKEVGFSDFVDVFDVVHVLLYVEQSTQLVLG